MARGADFYAAPPLAVGCPPVSRMPPPVDFRAADPGE
eukprot:gene7122-biopygen10528